MTPSSMVISRTFILINGRTLSIITTACIPLAHYCLPHLEHIFFSFLIPKTSSFLPFHEYLRSINSINCTLSSASYIYFLCLKAKIPWPIIFISHTPSTPLLCSLCSTHVTKQSWLNTNFGLINVKISAVKFSWRIMYNHAHCCS